LTGFEFFVKISEEAEQALIGLQAADGTTIERIHSHFVARVIGAYERQGVPIADIKDALLAPIAMKSRTVKGDRRIAFVGEGCSVAISIDDRLVIQTNPRKKKKKE
jgi:hypothetical protein